MEGGALASPDVAEEFLWSCSLSMASKVKAGPPCSVSNVDSFHQMFAWDPKESEDSAGNKGAVPSHRLLVKTAILMPEAKQYKVDIVEAESEGYNKKQVWDLFEMLCALNSLQTWQVTRPVVAMKGSVNAQKYMDLLVPSAPATFRLVSGARPLHLVGSHCVEAEDNKTKAVNFVNKEPVLFSNYDQQQVVDNLLLRFVACHMCNTPSSLFPGSLLHPTKPSEGEEGADTTK